MAAEPRPPAVIAHSPALDGLRGIAILLVLAHHLTLVQPTTAFEASALALLHTGWAGVDLFLVLSGFLITGILLDSRGSDRYFRNFYARRTLRIVPLYYSVVLFSYHVLPRFPTWYVRLVGRSEVPPERDFWLFLSNFTMAQRDQIQHGILGVSWSLAIEEQYYLAWAPIVWLCPPRSLGLLCIAIVIATPILRALAIASGASEIDVYVLTPYRADALAAGGWLACAARAPIAASVHSYGRAAAIAGIAGVSALVWWDGHTAWDGGVKQTVGYSFLALAASGLLLVAMKSGEHGWGKRLLSARLLRMFGRYSYCLYLIHLPVMWTVRATVFDPTRAPLMFDSVWPAQLIFWGLVILPAVGLAWFSWRFFEQPILRLKRFFPL